MQNSVLMERRVRGNLLARCGVGEKLEMTSKTYLSLCEVLSKALGSRTVMSGSVSKGKNDPSQSLQMMERALMTPDELKALPKGEFIVMKTGTYPMRTKLRLFLEWGITFEEPYQTPERAARKVTYAGKQELIHAILHDLKQRQQTECVDEENSSQMVDYNTQKREEGPA